MPTSTRWFIKSGMIYFIMGLTLAFISEFPSTGDSISLLPVYWHMLVIGWVTQLIIGVSVWMFPRKYRNRRKRESGLVWGTFWCLNIGLILRFLSEPFIPLLSNKILLPGIVIFASVLQVTAFFLYAAEIWPRLGKRKRIQQRRS